MVAGILEGINTHIDLSPEEVNSPFKVNLLDKVEPQHIVHLKEVSNNSIAYMEVLTNLAFKVLVELVDFVEGKEKHIHHLHPYHL